MRSHALHHHIASTSIKDRREASSPDIVSYIAKRDNKSACKPLCFLANNEPRGKLRLHCYLPSDERGWEGCAVKSGFCWINGLGMRWL